MNSLGGTIVGRFTILSVFCRGRECKCVLHHWRTLRFAAVSAKKIAKRGKSEECIRKREKCIGNTEKFFGKNGSPLEE